MNPDDVLGRNIPLSGVVQSDPVARGIVKLVDHAESGGNQAFRVSYSDEERTCQYEQTFQEKKNQLRSDFERCFFGCG